MKPIDITDLLNLMGRSLITPEIDTLLVDIGVKRRPYLEPEDIENGVYNQWLPIRKIGLELEFKHKKNFERFDAGDMNSANLLLTTLIFYSEREDIRPYPYELPYGLTFNDSPKAVHSKLEKSQCIRKSYIRDVFEFENHWLIVSYNPKRNAIEDITYMLISGKNIDSQQRNYPESIDYDKLLKCSSDDSVLHNLFSFIDFKKYSKDEDTHHDIIKTDGVEFVFWKNKLIYISLYATGYLDYSYGFKGPLPFEITFNDNPSVLLDKITQKPNLWEDDDLQGRAIWIFETYSLEIIYSTLLNSIAKISIYPSDFWDDDEDKDEWTVKPFLVTA